MPIGMEVGRDLLVLDWVQTELTSCEANRRCRVSNDCQLADKCQQVDIADSEYPF